MKKLYNALFIILLVCVAGTVVFLILSPDKVPVHYNFSGEVDRFGSKYENLIFPGLAVVLGLFFRAMALRERKRGEVSNEKVLLIAGVCTLGFFTLLSFYFMWKAIKYDPSAAPGVSFSDVNKFVSIGVGALLVALGNIIPKAKRNSMIGLRTKWSMYNDAVWQKSQRFCGTAAVISGFVMIVLALVIPGMWNILVLVVVILVMSVLCSAASYRYYKEEKE